jgi:hypothetical protein
MESSARKPRREKAHRPYGETNDGLEHGDAADDARDQNGVVQDPQDDKDEDEEDDEDDGDDAEVCGVVD